MMKPSNALGLQNRDEQLAAEPLSAPGPQTVAFQVNNKEGRTRKRSFLTPLLPRTNQKRPFCPLFTRFALKITQIQRQSSFLTPSALKITQIQRHLSFWVQFTAFTLLCVLCSYTSIALAQHPENNQATEQNGDEKNTTEQTTNSEQDAEEQEVDEDIEDAPPLMRTSIAILPPKGNLEEYPEVGVEVAFHAVRLFQQAGYQVIGPGQVTENLQNAGASACASNDWIECALLMREALAVDEVALIQVILLRGKPDQLTLLIVGKNGLNTSHTLQAQQTQQAPQTQSQETGQAEGTEALIQTLIFEALPLVEKAVKQHLAESALSLGIPMQEHCPTPPLQETETQYPIIGPTLLGAAGVALTSLAIASVAQERCTKKDPSGICLEQNHANTKAVFGMSLSGGALLAASVLWFVLGATEVPVAPNTEDTDAVENEKVSKREYRKTVTAVLKMDVSTRVFHQVVEKCVMETMAIVMGS